MIAKKINLYLAACVVIATCYSSCKDAEKDDKHAAGTKPNIIFILADDLGYGDLGCYGQTEIKTPNIDKLATKGMLFTQHYAGATVCAPSRNCLMTGQHNGNTTIKTMEKPLKDEDVTIAELLKSAGYSTAIIGKWGLGNTGTTGYANNQGFDYSFGYYDQIRAHNHYPDYLMENGEKYPLKNEVVYIRDSSHYAVGIGNAATKKVQYSNDIFTDKALEYINSAENNPFFLYLAFTIPHANNESWLIKQHGMEVPSQGIYQNKDWPEVKKSGAAMISRLDSYVGEIMDKLIDKGIDKETIVIFSSDNGPHAEGGWRTDFFNSSGGLKGMKRDLYEGGVRVPLIVHWPGKINPGKTNHVSAFWDFLPTACELAGVKLATNCDGISYMPTLLNFGAKQRKHKYLYWEFRTNTLKQAVRKGKWKALKTQDNQSEKVELYDLSVDPKEQTDLSLQHPHLVDEMEEIMKKYR